MCMRMTTEETQLAEEDVKKIHQSLQKMLADYPDGYTIRKSTLRSRFDLPISRSVKVWYGLESMGYETNHQKIRVKPSRDALEQKHKAEQEQQKKLEEEKYKQEQQEIEKVKAELAGVLDD